MEFPFVKMHGAGNDFVVVDGRSGEYPFEEIRKITPHLCNRRTGIGADGLLMLGASAKQDYAMHYLNADGSPAGMCGNGARCLALFAFMQGLERKLTFEVGETVYRAVVHKQYVSIHFPVHPEPEELTIDDNLWLNINTGTEHVVSIDDRYATASDETFRQIGRRIRNRSDLFPSGTNVNFAHVIDENRLSLTTYERGVEDLTLACGTGAIATAIGWHYRKVHLGDPGDPAGCTEGHREHYIQVDCPGGPLEVSFDTYCEKNDDICNYTKIALHGPAVAVYEGRFPA
ncbi:diaminopimelate epimerase [Balneolales bacterium ANBcel1]|nr:diaminopimelate epimerase [Balneolales bacterium ANBcel1]